MRVVGWALLGLVVACPVARADGAGVVVTSDEFSRIVEIVGIKGPVDPQPRGVDMAWALRSSIDKNAQAAAHQVYVDFNYTADTMGSFRASDDRATALKVVPIYQHACAFDQCPKQDVVGVTLDEATLRARADQGFRIKLVAKSGYSVILKVTPEMIATQFYADRLILSGAVVVGETVKSGDTIAAASDPEALRGARQGRAILDRFNHVRYRVIVAAAEFCGEHVAPVSGVSFATLSNIPAASRVAMHAAYPALGDSLSVLDVVPGSAAEIGGVRVGDLILAIDGAAVPRGEPAAVAALRMMRGAQYAPLRIGVRRDGTAREFTVNPARACSYRIERANDTLIDITGNGDLHGGLQDFARTDDELAAAIAFGIAANLKPGSDAETDQLVLAILARAGYALDAAQDLWRRLAEAKAPLTVSHPAPPERLAAMQGAIVGIHAKFPRTGAAP